MELEIESAAYRGVSVARREGLVIFVRGGVPGDRVRARVLRKKKAFAEAVLEELLESSPARVEPRCRHFGVCGGCHWQQASYPTQLEFKRQQVVEIFQHLGGGRPPVEPVLPAPSPYYYRNKMEFTFGSHRWLTREEIRSGEPVARDFALGLHIRRRWDKILDLEECRLQSPLTARILAEVRRLAKDQGWSPWDHGSHRGYLRNLVIRTAREGEEILVNLVTSREEAARMHLLKSALLAEVPQITTLVNALNPTRSPVPPTEACTVYHGPGFITDQIGSLSFRVGPFSFFQPNTAQAEHLSGEVLKGAALEGGEKVYDLYSGVGTLSLFLAGRAAEVVGIESHPSAVRDARVNAGQNGISNCSFHAQDVRQVLRGPLVAKHGKPDVIVTDPPRAGMHPEVCRAILGLAPARIVYVSCNPTTQVRDIGMLSNRYRVERVQPVDMFPQTYHIENVVTLVRRPGVKND